MARISSISLPDGSTYDLRDVFIAEYNTTTFSELLSAYNDDKTLFVKYNDPTDESTTIIAPLIGAQLYDNLGHIGGFLFSVPSGSASIFVIVCHLEDPGVSDDYEWMHDEQYIGISENSKSSKYYIVLNHYQESNLYPKMDTNDKYDTDATNAGLWYQDAILYTPALFVGDVNYTITTEDYDSIDSMLESLDV